MAVEHNETGEAYQDAVLYLAAGFVEVDAPPIGVRDALGLLPEDDARVNWLMWSGGAPVLEQRVRL